MVQNGQVEYDCGDNLKNFNELKLLQNYKNISFTIFKVLHGHRILYTKIRGIK